MEKEDSRNALLGASSLIQNYCKTKSSCGEENEVKAILKTIETKLGTACRSVTEEDKVNNLVVLKALGNAGRWVDAGKVLERCYAEENPMDVRVAAIETFRRAPCDYDREHLLTAFKNTELDSELRIAAYLAMMSCPNKQLIDILKDHLTSEGVNQVGSFVWTHLTNLQESAAPEKQWIRHLIGEELLQNKFNTESLKFSRNYESSFYTNRSEIGATFESNVIFSQKSFLPRSAMLNLTLELFGEKMNLFEVGGRIEGFESLVENFFGPDGYYPEETVSEVLKNLRKDKPTHDTTLEEFLDIAMNDPQSSVYLKMFGNDMYYNNFRGMKSIYKETESPDLMKFIIEMARKGKADYTKSKQLIDTTVVIPSISGFPISLKINSSATVGIQMEGKFNVKNMRNIDIEGKIHPSAAIEVDASLSIDAFVTKKGVKMTSNLHTSTPFDGKVKIEGGRLVDMEINMPDDKIEILKVRSEVFEVNDEYIVSLNPLEDGHDFCSTMTKKFLGLSMCARPYAPLGEQNTPYGLDIYMKKEDTHTGYVFKFNIDNNQAYILFDTPGSQVNRKWDLKISGATKNLDIELITPFTTATGKGMLDFDNKNQKFEAEITIDGSNKYRVKYNNLNSGRWHVWQSEKLLLIESPAGVLLNLYGNIDVNKPERKFGADLSLENLLSTPLKFHCKFKKHFS